MEKHLRHLLNLMFTHWRLEVLGEVPGTASSRERPALAIQFWEEILLTMPTVPTLGRARLALPTAEACHLLKKAL